MYIVSVFIANINTLSNNHEKVNKSSQIVFYQFLLLRNHSVTIDVFMGYL